MRVKGGRKEPKKHKKFLKQAKGYRLSRSKIYRRAQEAVLHSEQYALRDRRKRHAQMRKIWIMRINAALRNVGLRYKDFIHGMKENKIELDRKVLAEIAVTNPEAFYQVAEKAGLKAEK